MKGKTAEHPLVSVIVPVYNTQQWLGQCIRSLTEQTLRDVEIILVDDGSTDFSAAICDAWADNDERIHVFHQENQGVSAARNAGIRAARGDWIMFCDSDDFVGAGWCEHLVQLALRYPDAWICTGRAFVDNAGEIRKVCVYDNRENISIVEKGNYLNFFKSVLGYSVYNQIFCRDIICRKKLSFPEEVSYGEDVRFAMAYWKECKYGVVSNETPHYFYRQLDRDSLSTKFLGKCFYELRAEEIPTMREFITLSEEKDFLSWVFKTICMNGLADVLESRNPDSLEKQLADCQEIVDSPLFREASLAIDCEDIGESLLYSLRRGNFAKTYPLFMEWMNQKKLAAGREGQP